MKTITNFLLVLTLTASMAFADGHTGQGNRCDTCPPPCTENCGSVEYEEPQVTSKQAQPVEEAAEESLFDYWREVLTELFF